MPEFAEARKPFFGYHAADKDDVAEMVVEFCRTESITGQTLVVDADRLFH